MLVRSACKAAPVSGWLSGNPQMKAKGDGAELKAKRRPVRNGGYSGLVNCYAEFGIATAPGRSSTPGSVKPGRSLDGPRDKH